MQTSSSSSRPVRAGRAWPLVVAVSAAVLCACSVGNAGATRGRDTDPVSVYDADTPTTMPPTPPAPGPTVVGVRSPTTANALLDAVFTTWRTMVWTRYSHHDVEDPATGHYQFDCVGATNYFLSVADPNANDALRTTEHIGAHFVPSPLRLSTYLASLPPGGTPYWRPVTQASRIGPGEIIAVPPTPGSHEPGHAVMTAGPAVRLADGNEAVLVFDSTAAPGHGAFDSRRWDHRDQPLPNVANKPPNRRSGLGYGTIEVTASPSGAPQHILWSVGGTEYGGQIEIAQPLS